MTPPDDTEAVHPLVMREIGIISRDCEGRHKRTNEQVDRVHKRLDVHGSVLADHRDRLVELAGRSGREGKVGELEKDVENITEAHAQTRTMAVQNSSEIAKMKIRQFGWGAGGSAVGGGALVGVIEIIRHFI